jgi:hypothetical protein
MVFPSSDLYNGANFHESQSREINDADKCKSCV